MRHHKWWQGNDFTIVLFIYFVLSTRWKMEERNVVLEILFFITKEGEEWLMFNAKSADCFIMAMKMKKRVGSLITPNIPIHHHWLVLEFTLERTLTYNNIIKEK